MKAFLILIALLPGISFGKDWETLAKKLEENPGSGDRIFGLRDHEGRTMDCLEVFQPNGSTDSFGIYHTHRKGVFSVHLGKSQDFKTWTHLVELDQHASQAAMHETPDGAFLMAYEKDAPNSCWIGLRYYPDLASLEKGEHSREFKISRSLAPTAEGTPSFESVKIPNGDLTRSEIKLRFHFYKNAQVDQLASGTLTNFKDWKATPSSKLNQAFKDLGGSGNLGDRDPFIWQGSKFYVQEIQGAVGDWGSWGIYLCDSKGAPLRKLAIETPKKATAFSNPAVSLVRDQQGATKMIFTAYLHSRGSSREEIGQMLTIVNPE